MNRLAKVCARYLGGHRGFSIGIEDVTPSVQARVMRYGGKCDEMLFLHRDRIPWWKSRSPGCFLTDLASIYAFSAYLEALLVVFPLQSLDTASLPCIQTSWAPLGNPRRKPVL